MFRAYIAGHSETITDSPRVARAAFEELLARDDLIGQDAAAVLERDGEQLYVSRFDAELCGGRLHPAAPVDVFADIDSASALAHWKPRAC